MNEFQIKLLSYLNITEEEYFELIKDVNINDLEDPYNFLNMQKAVDRINLAINNNEKIMIYGDYDCDGISATAILVKAFMYLNKKVGYYIPSRYIDGYGLNLTRAKQIKDKGYNLVITVDNGVAANEAIDFLTNNNIDVILTDHHEISRELPYSYTILHPSLKINNVVDKQCGAYVSLMLSICLLNRIDPYLVSLATQATISDMMPLKGYNRILMKVGLKIINEHKEYPLYLLTNETNIDEETLGYTICPKINAFGRIKEDLSVNDMVRFFVIEDKLTLKKIAYEIEQVNNLRKNILLNTVNKLDLNSYKDKKIIVERLDNTSEGVIGLVAAKILNEVNKPCIVFTKVNNQNILKGSARSIKGFSLVDAFSFLSDLLEVYGGHEEAGGLSIKEENYNQFVNKLNEYTKDIEINLEEEKYLMIEKEDLNYENYLFIKSLSPFGMEYNKPKFLLNIDRNNITFMGKDQNHIKGYLSNNVSFVGFSLADKIIHSINKCLGTIAYDDFKKGRNVIFRIEKIL